MSKDQEEAGAADAGPGPGSPQSSQKDAASSQVDSGRAQAKPVFRNAIERFHH